MATVMRPPTATVPLRLVRRSLIGTRWAPKPSSGCDSIAPITTISHTTHVGNAPEPLINPSSAHKPGPQTMKDFQAIAQRRRKMLAEQQPQRPTKSSSTKKALEEENFTPKPSVPDEPLTEYKEQSLDPSVEKLLPILRAQPPHYVTIHIHEKPYLVTVGDSIRLPFIMRGVEPGDVLRLNRATLLGSRDYTLKAGAWTKDKEKVALGIPQHRKWIDERLFTCRARVIGVEEEPLRVKEKTRRRQRRVKHVYSQHQYTVLRICELEVHDVDALEQPRHDKGVTGGQEMEVTEEPQKG